MTRAIVRLTNPFLFSRTGHLWLFAAQTVGLVASAATILLVPGLSPAPASAVPLILFWPPFLTQTVVGVRERRELRRTATSVILTDKRDTLALAPMQGATFGYQISAGNSETVRTVLFEIDVLDERTVLVTVPQVPAVIRGNQPDTETAAKLKLAERRARNRVRWLPPVVRPGEAHA